MSEGDAGHGYAALTRRVTELVAIVPDETLVRLLSVFSVGHVRP